METTKRTMEKRTKAAPPSLQSSLVQDNVPCEVIPKLWIGSIHAAFNLEALHERKISHVLNVSSTVATYPQAFTYLTVDIRDKDYTNLLSCIPITSVFIEAGINQGGILVHCAGGRSRSPAIVMAYLMLTMGLSYEDALTKVRTARPVVALNSGFEDQLRCMEKAKRDIYLAHQWLLQGKIVRARMRRSQNLALELKKPEPRLLLGSVPLGFYLSRPPSTEPQFVPPLRTMGASYGCVACGTLLYCAANILRHNETTNAATWTIPVDRKRAISCPETPRGRNIPVRPFTENGLDEDEDEDQLHGDDEEKHDGVDAAMVEEALNELAVESARVRPLETVTTTSTQISVKQPTQNIWRTWTRFTLKKTDDSITWRAQMKVLEKRGSRHQIRRVSAAISEDEKQFHQLESARCDVVFIEPLAWLGKMQAASGSVHCLNSACNAEIGQWQWETPIECACGGVVAPSFAIRKFAVKILPSPPPSAPSNRSKGDKEIT
ncbi:unnamed protein product [Aphanomyces euteiches]|uniref:protein-tyrosine-phosphatase n=1 Tax=Aphanomyces euteiches TaxID=100861 RepID=A0A6G0WNR0_9STRA|nr:hypothetical protein Ae201684_013262 [Aphanomyces euteiches]KAH9156694.1 hypothetical protein AeRB84_001429 [Aphanomyces euteiches]